MQISRNTHSSRRPITPEAVLFQTAEYVITIHDVESDLRVDLATKLIRQLHKIRLLNTFLSNY